MTNMQRIRLGLLCVQIKLGMITKDAWSGQKDPNPENWRTISGAHVHLENGKIDGGAGGKFSGQEWNGKVAHGSEKRGRISNHIEGMKSLGLRQGLSEKLNNAYENYEDDKQGNLKTIRSQASERVRAEAEKKLSELKPPDMLELAKEFKYATRNNLSKEETKELDDLISKLAQGDFDYKPKGRMENLFGNELKGKENLGKKTKIPMQPMEYIENRLKQKSASQTPKEEKSTTPKKKGNAKSRLEDNAKAIGVDLAKYRTDGGSYDKRNTQYIRIDDMPEKEKAAFTQMLKEKGYKTSWSGGFGTAIMESQERKTPAPKPYEYTAEPEGYQEYLKRKQAGQTNSYEERQEARRERYENRSAAASNEAHERMTKSMEMMSAIPFGQPIHVGHYSEKSDRAFRNRAASQFEKSLEAREKADYYSNKAESVGKGGISGLDPDAKYKVYERLNNREKLHDKMLQANSIYRSTADPEERISKYKAAGFSEKAIAELSKATGTPFASFTLQNNRQEISRLKDRLDSMGKETATSTASESNSLYDMSVSEGRYQFKFAGKPDEAVRNILKKNGFKCSPSRGTWVRQATGNGEHAVRRVQEELKPFVEEEYVPF